MKTEELLIKIAQYDEAKKQAEKIEELYEMAYIYMLELKSRSKNLTLSVDFVNEVEQFYLSNHISFEKLDVKNPYLKRYFKVAQKFWSVYEYHDNTNISRGKFNLFTALKEKESKLKYDVNVELDGIIKNIISLWLSAHQIFLEYSINSISKKYIK